MDIFIVVFIVVLIFWIIYKITEFIQSLFFKLPEWHDKHGEKYIQWKKDKGI
jgi:predicted PurR-regulated permease PerM